MYPIDRSLFPPGQAVAVPYYKIVALEGRILVLTPSARRVHVDFTAFGAHILAQAASVQLEEWELRGVMALEALPFAEVLYQVAAQGQTHHLGTVLADTWYFLRPIEPQFSRRVGQPVVVGLYR